MTENGKRLSNSFSTGSGGARFEANIQATFVTLMLSGGYAPCLPAWPISEIKLQGAVDGYATDDLIVFVENSAKNDRRRLLGQVKHSIGITIGSELFSEVIQAAWSDFNNSALFTKGKDVIALITGPINSTDTDGVNWLLEQARHTNDSGEFFTKVSRAHFCSNNARSKLLAFKAQLKIANNGNDLEEQDLYEFLKHFHLLGYDLSKKGSVVSSLLQSHIAQFNKDIPDKIWHQIVCEVQNFNQNAGTITFDTLPEDLVKHFDKPTITHIPKALAKEIIDDRPPEQLARTEWNQHLGAQKLAIANLIGKWNENNEADIGVIVNITGENYTNWIATLREALQVHDCPLNYKDGLWSFKNRLRSWEELGTRIFDDNLDLFKAAALEVLLVDDPAFELVAEERYAASIQDKVLPHSGSLREGLAETLALIGSRPSSLTNCTQGKAGSIASLAIRELFHDCDWVRWGSLNSLLPTISEGCPDEFISAVEAAVVAKPSPFDELFEQESTGVFGRSYIAGLLWALEGIAWEEVYLSRTAVVLAEIASHDPGGNWSNRPSNSLADIFLPWLPHTLASVQKRKAALKIICAEQPEVGWALLERLLPGQHSTTSGTHKPIWRNTIPDDWEKGVTNEEYWDQSKFCSDLIVELAGFDVAKLALLVGNANYLTPAALESLRSKLLSEACISLTEVERLPVWTSLCKLIAHHRRFPDAKWSFDDEFLVPLEEIEIKLAPTSPNLLHKRLFTEHDAYLYQGDGDWGEQQEKIFQIRKKALQEILADGGMSQVLEFSSELPRSNLVGEVLGSLESVEIDLELLPEFLNIEDKKLRSFVAAYAWRRWYSGSWQWFDEIDKADWEPRQIALLLCALPFEKNAWDRVTHLLGENEIEYWKYTSANIYQGDADAEYGLLKLLEYKRPGAVIEGFRRDLVEGNNISPDLACDALLALVQVEDQSERIDHYHIAEIIKSIQSHNDTNQDKLFHVEWAYLNLLDEHSEGSPVTLENRIASDPNFFCELIQLVYRAEGVESVEEVSDKNRTIAENAYRLLSIWRTVPGSQVGTQFDSDAFLAWLVDVDAIVEASGHGDVAMITLGGVLVYSPEGPDGLWIHSEIAEVMNGRGRSRLRDGYRNAVYNSRGAHWVDPEAKAEIALAEKYRQRAEDVENSGYQRFAKTLRDLAETYDQEAERIVRN